MFGKPVDAEINENTDPTSFHPELLTLFIYIFDLFYLTSYAFQHYYLNVFHKTCFPKGISKFK